jgi:hypothetical protein
MRSRELVSNLKEHIGAVTGIVRVCVCVYCESVVLCQAHLIQLKFRKQRAFCRLLQVLYDDDVHALTCSRDKSFLCWDLRVRVPACPAAWCNQLTKPHLSLTARCCTHVCPMQREKRVSSHTLSSGMSAVALTPDQSLVITAGQDKKLTCVQRTPSRSLVCYCESRLQAIPTAVAHTDVVLPIVFLCCEGQVLGLAGARTSPDDRPNPRRWRAHLHCGPYAMCCKKPDWSCRDCNGARYHAPAVLLGLLSRGTGRTWERYHGDGRH